MGAAIHASALQQQPLLGPGCVMLLQDVSVLTPHPGSCYLAVTAGNIVQVSRGVLGWCVWGGGGATACSKKFECCEVQRSLMTVNDTCGDVHR